MIFKVKPLEYIGFAFLGYIAVTMLWNDFVEPFKSVIGHIPTEIYSPGEVVPLHLTFEGRGDHDAILVHRVIIGKDGIERSVNEVGEDDQISVTEGTTHATFYFRLPDDLPYGEYKYYGVITYDRLIREDVVRRVPPHELSFTVGEE